MQIRLSRSSMVMLLLCCGALSACSGSSDDTVHTEPAPEKGASDGPRESKPPAFRIGNVSYERLCTRTAQSACSSRCSECWDTCYSVALGTGSLSCTSTCDRICDCSATSSDTCFAWSHTFDLGPSDTEVAAACGEYDELLRTCELRVPAGACAAFAKVEGPRAVATYRCIADELRNGVCESSSCELPVADDGTRLCAQSRERCGECPLDLQRVNEDANWLRDDVRAAAFKCLELPACTDVLGCLAAWQKVALPL